jgi:phospholipid transport system transporter-binding protein
VDRPQEVLIKEAGEAGGARRFRIVGTMDFAGVPALYRRGLELFASCDRVALDLSEISRSDSAGLALLLEWQRHARQAGQTLTIDSIPESLRNLARISELETFLPEETCSQ